LSADATEPLAAGLRRDQLHDLYQWMCLVRAAEDRLEILQKQGHVTASIYRSLGQEAGAVGAAFALRRRADGRGDFLAHTVRAVGALFLFGASLEDYFRQYLGRATGPTRGKEANLHWGNHQLGFLGTISPLGTMLEVMAGVTLAFQLRGEERVGMVFYGDGATSTGAWHEGLCVAAGQLCPLVLVVENNQWAFSTPLSKTTRLKTFVDKAPGYGITAESVDGTDVLAVFEASRRAVARARAGDGVQLIELHYFRRLGHAQHDSQDYVDPALLAEWAEKDPLDRHRARLLENAWASEAELDAIWAGAEAACVAAAEQVITEPQPAGPEALEDVLADSVVPIPWTRLDHPDPRAA
jgi:pyruvate dehydrogenase E1 component alpha subunit/2-oxoisovalerate dehydrogenase E1 component alpha subunit